MPRSTPSSWSGLDPLESRQLLAFVLWDGGGGDSDWNNPLNWSTDALPGAADNVLIDTSGHPTIHRSANVSDTIASLWSLNPIDISGGTLTVNGQWKQSAALFMSAGQVHGGNLVINGDALWIGGTIDGGSNILIYPGRQLSIGGDVTLGRSIYNNGSLRWTDGDITTNGGSIQNLTDRTFTVGSGGTLRSSGAPARLLNFGTLIRDGNATTTTTIDVIFSNYPAYVGPILDLTPPGIVDVRSGTLSFTGTVVEKPADILYGNGSWMVSSSTGRLLLPGPDITAVAGTVVLNGSGAAFPQIESASEIANLTLSGGRAFTFNNLGTNGYTYFNQLVINNPGITTVVPRLSINSVAVQRGEVRFSHGLDGTVLRVDAGATVTLAGASMFSYAEISGAGLVRITGDVGWFAGTIDGPGQLLITASGHLHNTGGEYWQGGEKTLTRRTVNYGTLSIVQSPFAFGLGTFAFSTEIVNRGVMNLEIFGYLGTTAGIGPGSAPAFITNFGTINSTSVATWRGAGGGVRLNNQGTVHVISGSLTLNGGVSGGGTWITDDGAQLIFGGLGSVLSGAAFSGLGQVRQAAAAYWTNPTINGAWQLFITTPGRLTLLGSSTSITVGDVRNEGLIRLGDGVAVQVTGAFYNSNQLDVGAGSLHITGDFNLNPLSSVRVRSAAPAEPPRITVGGNTDLKGSITVSFAWSPQAGDLFDYMTFGSRTGGFVTTTAEGVSPPAVPLFVYGATNARVLFGIF